MNARFGSATFRLQDCTTTRLDASVLLGPTRARDPGPIVQRRAEALLDVNRGLLRDVGVSGHVAQTRGAINLVLSTGTTVGAIPLL